ncbi:MAG: hypothetical protein EPN77_19305 [Candidimonas sp.]|nr:MAG: hypothetical protein EPN77_19305 [Candidimonas sp.]
MNSKLDANRQTSSPMAAAMANLEAAFGAEHPEYRRAEHQREIERGDTRLWTYWEWVVHQMEAAGISPDTAIVGTKQVLATDPLAIPRDIHKRLFARYIANLTLADAKEIFEAIEGCWHEQLNGNKGSQLKAQDREVQAVSAAVDHMLTHDLGAIDGILAAAAKPSAPVVGR